MKFLEDCKFEWILFFILQLFLWPRALSLFLNNARTSCLSLLSDADNLPFCFGEQRASTRPTPCIRSEKERGVSSPFPAFRIPRDVLIPWHMFRQRDRKLREGKQSGGSRPSIPHVPGGGSEPAGGRPPPGARLPCRDQVPAAGFTHVPRESFVGSERSAPLVLVLCTPQAAEKSPAWGNCWQLAWTHVTRAPRSYSRNPPGTNFQCGSKL